MKTLLKKYKYLALAGALLLTGYTGVNAWANFPYGGNQVVAHGDAVALQANGQIAWSSNPGWASTDGQGMTMAEAASYVRGCSSQSGNTLITNAQLQACRVLFTQASGTIGSGYREGPYYTATYNSKLGTYTCLYHSGGASSGTPYSTSSTAQPPSASTPMSISLTGLSLSNGSSTNWVVSLINPSGTAVASWTGTTSTFSITVTSASSGGVGTWQWAISSSGGGASCDPGAGVTSGDYVNWTGSSFTYYQ